MYQEIEINIQAINGDKKKGLAVFRLNANAIQEALSGILGTGVSEDAPEAQEQPNEDNRQPAESDEAAYDYKVVSVKPSGQNSLLLELVNKDGNITAAYIKAGEQKIAVGSCLNNVDIQLKTGTYGDYNLINTCQVAA